MESLDQVISQLPEPVIVTSELGEIVWGNASAVELMESSLENWIGRNMLDAVHPDDVARVVNALGSVVHQDQGELLRLRLLTASGVVREVETRGSRMELGGQAYLVNVLRPVEDRFDMAVDGGDPTRQRALLDHSPAVLALLDDEMRFLTASNAISRLLGLDTYKVRGHRFSDFVAPGDRQLLDRALARLDMHAHLTIDMPDTTGGIHHFDAHFTDLRADPSVNAVVATLTDVSDLKEAERQLRFLAEVDSLTGALNRRAFGDALESALRRSTDIAVLYCDLDGFKPINDAHGHQAGDAVLIDFVQRLKDTVRGADLVGRLGGDEFAVALLGDADAGAEAIRRRIGDAMEAPIRVDGSDVNVGVSIGTALADEETTATELLARADAAMYDEKRRLGSSR